jgi:alginate O-acetyltransferase complex protein AlgI
LYARLPPAVRVALTFAIVLVAWVFFRAHDLGAAGAYLANMFGAGAAQEGARLLGGVIYQPYYLGTVALAAAIIWLCPQTWDWTRTMTTAKAVAVAALFILASVALTTQAYNPFIYFIF